MKGILSKSVIISLLCTLFQYYAFSVYAFSAVLLSPIFFRSDNLQLTKTLGLITLSITLLLKPIGSILFGHIGDKYGRKKALSYSLLFITIATTSIGLIPSYSYAGWLSTLFLIMCLFVQGLCIGGQYTGALIFIQEHMDKKYASFSCGLVGGIGIFGAFLGTATSFFIYDLIDLDWEWRVPFLFTSIFGMLLWYLTKHIKETPIFVKSKEARADQQVPLFEIMKNHKRVLCSSIFLSSISVSMFYLATVYLPNFYRDQGGENDVFDTLSLTCIAQIVTIIFIPFFGFSADKYGKEKQLKFASGALILVPFFLFYAMTVYSNIYVFLCGILFLSVFVALYAGASPAYLSEKFPVIGRYSGLGLGISLGEGLIGGLSPLACVWIEQKFNSKVGPAFYIMFLGLLSFAGILLSRTKEKRVKSKGFPLENSSQNLS